MPEGDTVWLACRRLHDALAGDVLTRSDFRVPALATTDLSGQAVTEVVSRGKHLLIRLSGDLTLHTHFRMDGTWHLHRPGSRWRGGPAWQVRVVLATRQWQAVGFRLPVVDLLPRAEEGRVVGHLGPDVLGEDWDPDEAVRRLRADGDRPVGEALLDQRNLAGLGTLYQTEVCFLAGVTPWLPVAEVPDLRGAVVRAHRLLRANKDTFAQVTTSESRRGRQTHVFERAGRPCPRCGTTVLTAEQGTPPRQRVAYWCPRCQRGPAPSPLRPRDRRPPPRGYQKYVP